MTPCSSSSWQIWTAFRAAWRSIPAATLTVRAGALTLSALGVTRGSAGRVASVPWVGDGPGGGGSDVGLVSGL